MGFSFQFLGWNAHQIYLGDSNPLSSQWTAIRIERQLGDIRNCSYAAEPQWIGVTAEDKTDGQQILMIYECQTNATRVLLRLDYILHHCLNRAGSKVCYTRPSISCGAADLYIYQWQNKQNDCLARAAVAHDSVPAWFPDDVRIAYHSPAGQVMVFDSSRQSVRELAPGRSPAISADGGRLAFQRDNTVFMWNQTTDQIQPLSMRIRPKGSLTDGLSWSPAGEHLSFGAITGMVDKETSFFLLRIATGECEKLKVKYLRSLLIINNSRR